MNLFQLKSIQGIMDTTNLPEIITLFLKWQLFLGKKFQILLYRWDASTETVVESGMGAWIHHSIMILLHFCYIVAQMTTTIVSSSCSTPGDRATAFLFTLVYVSVGLGCEWSPDSSGIQLMNIITKNSGVPREGCRSSNLFWELKS